MTHPSNYLPLHPDHERFLQVPDSKHGMTMVTCAHPYHGVGILYFNAEDYISSFHYVTRGLWINGFTMIIQDMQGF